MTSFAVAMVVVALIVTTAWYVPLIVRGHAHPVPATFIIAVAAFWIASFSHLAVPGGTLFGKLAENITLYVAAVQSTLVLVVITYTYAKAGEWKVAFDGMQKFCFLVMFGSLTYWFVNKDQPGVTYWTVQVLMVLAYTATLAKIVHRKFAFDSIGMWATITVASCFGFIPALDALAASGSWYGVGNSVRSFLMSGMTAALFFYYDRLHGHVRWQAEKQILLDTYGWYKFTQLAGW